MITSSIN